MKHSLLLLIAVFTISTIHAQSAKRGMAYGYHSPEDLQILSPDVSWWYNWSEAPESSVANVYGNYGFEFVPMVWDENYSTTKLRAFLTLHPETKYLLAFNEPNFLAQANLKPSQVAALWPALEAIADEFNLEIVAPAVNYCGDCVTEGGVTYTNPVKYLDDFFAACPTCRVDHIAVHCYMNHVSALKSYIDLFKKYGKPIWLTEFAGWEYNGAINNVNDQISFMIGAVDFLETDPDVFRYSWFIGRGNGINTFPYIDLLGANGTLTALGDVYKNMPIHDVNNVIDIPNTIEAEAYNSMSGILIEKTADQFGFANVGYIEANDWLEYKINVPTTDEYDIRFRTASTKTASFNILVDGVGVLTQNITNSGGWQSWATTANKINLTTGIHTIRLQAITDGFNINWIQIGNVAVTGMNVLPTTKTINKGATYQLTAIVDPSNASIKNVNWSSSDITIATVTATGGLVKGIKAGNATITATTVEGSFTSTCDVTVEIGTYFNEESLSNINLGISPNPASINMKVTGIENASLLAICSINGKELIVQKVGGECETSFNIESLSKGVYLLKATIGNSSQTKIFIKE